MNRQRYVLFVCMAMAVFAVVRPGCCAFAADGDADEASAWRGGAPETKIVHEGKVSVRWAHAKSSQITRSFSKPQDWSKYGAVRFWLCSEKATGSRFVVTITSENPKSVGWDYFYLKIKLDWTGWREFLIPFNELSQMREPLGWQRIERVSFSAAGWGNQPDPQAVVYLDGFEPIRFNDVAIGPRMTDEELFAALDLEQPALEKVKEAARDRDWKSAKHALSEHLRSRTTPHWYFDWRDHPLGGVKRPARDHASGQRKHRKADDYLALKFAFRFAGKEWKAEFKDRIDWAANATEGTARTQLWNESLNRHYHLKTLARAYWDTGNEKYARGVAEHLGDWIEQNPAPRATSGNAAGGKYAWQTLSVGVRLEMHWPEVLYRCLGSPAFTDELLANVMKSVHEQVNHLIRWPTRNNWLTEESTGMFTAGMLFPEFKEARTWRKIALERLHGQLDEEVYPDGMEYELAAGYNNWVLSNFAKILQHAELNGLQDEIPVDFVERMEKMYNYLLYASMPDGKIPGLNDSWGGNKDVTRLLARGYELFPDRKDFLFGVTRGSDAAKPRGTSCEFPYAGHYVMRSGWDADAVYLLLDSGRLSFGHSHEDKLHFVLYAHGKQHVLDPGNYSYDQSKWRQYVKATAGHNTILVDGQGQNRRRKPQGHPTHIWPRPWTEPKPPSNDTLWVSNKTCDYARGTYRDGYGPKNDSTVTHTRSILFVKPEYFIIVDTLKPADDKPHRYESLFHLDAPEAVTDGKTVMTKNADASNLIIAPLPDDKLQVRIVKGQEDPVQGWANDPWRAIPCAVYTKEQQGTTHFFYVLYPVPKGTEPPQIAVKPIECEQLAVEIALKDGRRDVFFRSAVPGKMTRFGEFSTDAEAAWARLDRDGTPKEAFVAGGSRIERKGKRLP